MKRAFKTALSVLFIILVLSSCHGENKVYSVLDMSEKTVGVISDTASAGYIARFELPVEVRYFEDSDELATALRNGNIDCALTDERTAKSLTRFSLTLDTIDDKFVDCDYRLAVSVENKELLDNLNSAIRSLTSSGALDEILDTWQDGGEGKAHETDTGRTKITVAIDPSFYPYAFSGEDGAPAGLEIDVIWAVCEQLGLEPDFVTAQPGMLLYMAESGKTSFAIGRIIQDPDNEAVGYTIPYMHSTQLIVVRK